MPDNTINTPAHSRDNIPHKSNAIWAAYQSFDPKLTFDQCVFWLAFRFQMQEREVSELLFERIPRHGKLFCGINHNYPESLPYESPYKSRQRWKLDAINMINVAQESPSSVNEAKS